VFVHGALCVAYSGQCLTSEAIGGRSANRGACAQACRLPYELVVDGELRDTGERAYLLSAARPRGPSERGPRARRARRRVLKIEGRLKGAAYVAATTGSTAPPSTAALEAPPPSARLRDAALQTFTRGSGSGFLEGVDHQRLVEGRGCDHRGLQVGTLRADERRGGGRAWPCDLDARWRAATALLVEGGAAGAGELGGRVWAITQRGADVERAPSRATRSSGSAPSEARRARAAGRACGARDDPAVERAIREAAERDPHRHALSIWCSRARAGAPAVLTGRTSDGSRGACHGRRPGRRGAVGRPSRRSSCARSSGASATHPSSWARST
jgi:putative protease